MPTMGRADEGRSRWANIFIAVRPAVRRGDSMLALSFPSRPILCVASMQTRSIVEPAMVGFSPVFTESACDAIRTANTAVFDAYLIDYWVPEWTGLQLCRQIRLPRRNAPLVVYYGAKQVGPRSRAIQAGATAFLLSPLDAETLCRSLAFLLDARDHDSIRAWVVEQAAVQVELTRQAELIKSNVENAGSVVAQANARIARDRAYKAYIEAGGLR